MNWNGLGWYSMPQVQIGVISLIHSHLDSFIRDFPMGFPIGKGGVV